MKKGGISAVGDAPSCIAEIAPPSTAASVPGITVSEAIWRSDCIMLTGFYPDCNHACRGDALRLRRWRPPPHLRLSGIHNRA